MLRTNWTVRPALPNGRFIHHVQRNFNSSADNLANCALDRGAVVEGKMFLRIPANSIFVLSSDGASRGNPGPSSAAATISVVQGHHTLLVAWRGICIGVRTSVEAEFEAAVLAQRLFVDYMCFLGLTTNG